MDTRKVGLFLAFVIVCMVFFPKSAFAASVIICSPNAGITQKPGMFSDEPLDLDTSTGKVSRIRSDINRAIAQFGCDTRSLFCGNGIVELDEQCDDGNNQDGDGCSAICITEVAGVCGNNIPEPPEECDTGGESAVCDVDCTLALCGDGFLNVTAGEQCDDGVETATCDIDCTLTFCGDGFLNVTAGEQCDDGNLVDGDGCSASCFTEVAVCGDAIVEGAEQCDGTNLGSDTCLVLGFDGGTLACNAMCEFDTSNCAVCGNNTLEVGEQCDGTDLGGETCVTLGFDRGPLACSPACFFDTSACVF